MTFLKDVEEPAILGRTKTGEVCRELPNISDHSKSYRAKNQLSDMHHLYSDTIGYFSKTMKPVL